MVRQHWRGVLILAVLTLIVVACGNQAETAPTAEPAQTTTDEGMADEQMDEEMADEMSDEEMGDVLAVAQAQGDLNTFLAALDAAGIMDDLHGEGPFTLFIPTDDAFATYLDQAGMSQDEAFAGAGMLQTILGYHIIALMEDSEMVMGMDGGSFLTLSGLPLDVTVEGDTVMVGNATVERYDLHASNGVIHVIDRVLIPPEG